MPQPLRFVAHCVLIAVTVVAPGCGKRLRNAVGLPNQSPLIRIENTSVSGGSAETISARLRWTATDADGRVDHYLVTRDLAALNRESGWSVVGEREQTLSFRRPVRPAAALSRLPRDDFEFFAVRAVDDRGARSELEYRAFFGENLAPTVRITQPFPSEFFIEQVPPSFWVRWAGSDPDGPNGQPAKYKYAVFQRPPNTSGWAWLEDPDSLRRQFAPTFPGWDSISGDSTRVRLTNLAPGSQYLFVITALDTEGAYDPVFSLTKNLLRMSVSTWLQPPRITLFSESFTYSYATGGISTDSSWIIRIEAPARQPLIVQWYAEASPVSRIAGYRWALDIPDITDETPRAGKHDLSHWSAWDLSCTSATLGPFHGAAFDVPHRLYVEAADENGATSLGIVQFRLIRPAFDRDLLIVDDTRFQVDEFARIQPPGRTDSLRAPFGAWPSRAELDTFLFAVGGVRWRMAPAGRLSPQGIFKGYRFDTLGTRGGLANPTIPLDVLGHYRHVVWMTDRAAGYDFAPNSQTLPQPTLLYMSARDRQNTLAIWVSQGGKLWALGGGFGNATNKLWNNMANDSNQTRTYSSSGTRPDLGLGRFMYDLAHWRSEFKVIGPVFCRIARAPFPPGGHAAMPSYTALPATLRAKQAGTDPIWPYRMPVEWFVGNPLYSSYGYSLEYLSKPNVVIDDWDTAPRRARDVSALDTLMVATGAPLPSQGANPAVDRIVNPVMTLYRGQDCGPVVFSGFDCWTWTQADCVGLVDAVLQGIWGLSRNPGAGGTVVTRPASSPALPVVRRIAG